nr:metal ABC transporter substrate-binding protein [uncultured Mediterraneibacter sp.]
MKKRRVRDFLLAGSLILGMMLTGCGMSGQQTEQNGGKEQNTEENKKISVVATIFPQYDFVRQIAGDNVELKMLLKPGEETHSYEPTPQDIIAIQNSDLFIYVGGENDAWVEDILESMPDNGRKTLKLVDCVDTVEEEHVEGMKEERGHDHDDHDDHDEDDAEHEEDEADHEEHGLEDTHSVHEIDEHVWTSPLNAIKIVEQIKEELCEIDPENASDYEENAEAYVAQLNELDQEFQDVVDHSKRKLMIFGDRFPFRYFAEEYDLDYYAAFSGCASDTEPSAATMAFLINKVRDENIKTVLKMELSNENIAKAIAEATNADVKEFYSCHNLTAEQFADGETYLSLMEKNVETLREVLN